LNKPIADIQLLGSDETIEWSQSGEWLTIETPKKMPSDYAIAFKITIQ
jgi:alpha-L-fucosidase